MPSCLHEGLVDLFKSQPDLATGLLTRTMRVKVPDGRTMLEANDLTSLEATEYRADAVVVLGDDQHRPRLGVVVEVQLRKDWAKHTSWPCYVTNLRARLECPVALLVVCPDEKVATWSSQIISLGPPDSAITPVVYGPNNIPAITDPDEAMANPGLCALSAVAHSNRPEHRRPVFEALVHLIRNSDDDERAMIYTGLVQQTGDEARKDLKTIMDESSEKYRDYGSDWVNRFADQGRREGEKVGRAEGRTEGEANALLTILTTRGLTISDDARERINSCTDSDQLDAWLKLAVTVDRVDDLFT